MKQEQTEVLIIGAGPSGCVSAAYLQQQGIKVRMVEKTRFPRLVGKCLEQTLTMSWLRKWCVWECL